MSDKATFEWPETMQLAQFTEGRVRLDERAFSFRIERVDGAKFDLWCDSVQFQEIIAFVCGLFAAAAEQAGAASPLKTKPINYHLIPVPILAVSFDESAATPNKTALVLTLPGFALGFEVEKSGLLSVAEEFSRVAQSLAAGSPRKQ
jgi:hypothetical protein